MPASGNQMNRCLIGDGHIAYHRAGRGEPILLVHGITSNSFIWNPTLKYLTNGWDVIAVDLLGCGESDRPEGADLSIRAHARRLREFVDTIGLDQFHLVGHDIGGGIAQVFAVNNGDRLRSLALVNSVGYDFWPVQPIIAIRTPFLRQLAMATLDMGMLRIIIRRAIHHKERLTSELLEKFHHEVASRENRRCFLRFTRCLDNSHLLEISDALKEISFPTLIIRGEQDVYLSAEISRRLHEDIPFSRLVQIGEAGHFIQIDQPELLARHLMHHVSEATRG